MAKLKAYQMDDRTPSAGYLELTEALVAVEDAIDEALATSARVRRRADRRAQDREALLGARGYLRAALSHRLVRAVDEQRHFELDALERQ